MPWNNFQKIGPVEGELKINMLAKNEFDCLVDSEQYGMIASKTYQLYAVSQSKWG